MALMLLQFSEKWRDGTSRILSIWDSSTVLIAPLSPQTFPVMVKSLKTLTYIPPDGNSGASRVDHPNSGFIAVIRHREHLLLVLDQDNLGEKTHEIITTITTTKTLTCLEIFKKDISLEKKTKNLCYLIDAHHQRQTSCYRHSFGLRIHFHHVRGTESKEQCL